MRKTLIIILVYEKVIILRIYFNFTNIFLEELAIILLKQTSIDKYNTDLKVDKQSPYK